MRNFRTFTVIENKFSAHPNIMSILMSSSRLLNKVLMMSSPLSSFFPEDGLLFTSSLHESPTTNERWKNERWKKKAKINLSILILFYTIHLASLLVYTNGPRRMKTFLRGFANDTGADQPAHQRSLISTFVICFLESTICKLATGEI